MASDTREGLLYIDGERCKGSAGSFPVEDPATGTVIGRAAKATAEDARRAVDAAAAAFPAWSKMPGPERAAILRRVADRIMARSEEIARVMTAEQGKPLAEARGEVRISADYFSWNGEEARRIYGDLIPASTNQKRLLVLRQPVGVTAAITPWNFPASMLARKIAPALAAGCTVVCKPASATPLTACALFDAMEEAGLPKGVANLVTGPAGAVVGAWMDDGRVRKVSFTGSTEVGKELMRGAAAQMKRVSLELGGHAPFLIFADADLDAAAAGLVMSKFRNAGQTCICANRLYVERTVAEELAQRIRHQVEKLKVGPGAQEGVEVGPLIDHEAVQKVHAQVQDAVSRGGRVLCGGHALREGAFAQGHFYAPTVVTDLPYDALVAREETFGPLIGLWPFDTEEEAIALANDTPYGLASYVYTQNLGRAFRVAEGLEYGIVGLNDPVPTVAQAPFGGVKESGVGREGGYEGVLAYLETKFVSMVL